MDLKQQNDYLLKGYAIVLALFLLNNKLSFSSFISVFNINI